MSDVEILNFHLSIFRHSHLGPPCGRDSSPSGQRISGPGSQLGCIQSGALCEAGSDEKLRHLLDDSVLEEPRLPAPHQHHHHHDHSLDNGGKSGAVVAADGVEGSAQTDEDEEELKLLAKHSSTSGDSDEFGIETGMQCCLMQGCVRRKTIVKDGKKPAVTSWQRYWVQLWGTSLVFYPPKSFKGCDRSDYKRDPCKMVSVVGWLVFLYDSPLQPDLFQLTDPNRGNVYKFRAGTKSAAIQWYRYLQQAITGNLEKPLPANLMSFE
ncbi:hypothetical protein J437_LFUL013624 [Ladona fulva]|uniref:PH domain-containing protein n=1 Tax=Ladona fulva TaxID=123851 RepID=A0A8K0KGJ2_LADFU|nr:hypothetical protein J437_LFUL013624 [Ladona fulva]